MDEKQQLVTQVQLHNALLPFRQHIAELRAICNGLKEKLPEDRDLQDWFDRLNDVETFLEGLGYDEWIVEKQTPTLPSTPGQALDASYVTMFTHMLEDALRPIAQRLTNLEQAYGMPPTQKSDVYKKQQLVAQAPQADVNIYTSTDRQHRQTDRQTAVDRQQIDTER